MLLHEWLQYRDRRIRKLRTQMDEQEEQAEAQQQAEQAPEAFAPPQEPAAEAEPVTEPPAGAAVQQPARAAEAPQQPAEDAETGPSGEGEAGVEERPKRKRTVRSPQSAREVLETLQPSQDLRARLEAVLARQKRLPLEDVEDSGKKRPKRRRVVETREQLVERLLDPTLTLQEAALLLGVCPTTVRRYTNRGILKCFRTPGNQRRFKLSDILEFMERREREATEEEQDE